MLRVDTARMEEHVTKMNEIAGRLDELSSCVMGISQMQCWNSSIDSQIHSCLSGCARTVSELNIKARSLARLLNDAATMYAQAENTVKDAVSTEHAAGKDQVQQKDRDRNVRDGIIDWIRNLTWDDFLEPGYSMLDLLYKGVKTYPNYRQLGNAIGGDKAVASWLKNMMDLKVNGHWSTAKNPCTNFVNNLIKNKTSPIRNFFKETADNLVGKNGVADQVVAWGGIVIDGVCNFVDNLDEQEKSGGTMSDVRVGFETVTETAVETAITYAVGAVLSAAIAAGAAATGATIAMPAVAITAIGGLSVMGINVITRACTDETATEHISDFLLDKGEEIVIKAKEVLDFGED